MPPSNPRPAHPFYAPELTPSERKEFDRLRQFNPSDEVALLRILIRRMLHTLNHASTFNETVQSVNALSYLAGRLAKLLESAVQPDPAADLSTSYFLALQEVLGRFNLPPPSTALPTPVATPLSSSASPLTSVPSSNSVHTPGPSPESPGHTPPSSLDSTNLIGPTSQPILSKPS